MRKNIKNNHLFNRIIVSSLGVTCALLLSSCGIETDSLSQEEIDKIGEYSALLMLGKDPDSSRLVDIEEQNQETEVSDEEPLLEDKEQNPDDSNDSNTGNNSGENASGTTDSSSNSSDNTKPDIEIVDVTNNQDSQQFVPMEQFLGLADGVSMIYRGYEWNTSLTNDSGSYFFDPSEGNSFLIINYTIHNASGSVQDINFLYAGMTFSARINDEKTIIAMEVPIDSDFPTYIGKLSDGSSIDLNLMFECPESYNGNISSLKLTIKNRDDIWTNILE